MKKTGRRKTKKTLGARKARKATTPTPNQARAYLINRLIGQLRYKQGAGTSFHNQFKDLAKFDFKAYSGRVVVAMKLISEHQDEIVQLENKQLELMKEIDSSSQHITKESKQ